MDETKTTTLEQTKEIASDSEQVTSTPITPETAETFEPEEFDKRLTALFESRKFQEYIDQIPESLREQAIGTIIEYNILHKDGFLEDEFLALLKEYGPKSNYKIAGFYTNSIAKKLNLSDLDSKESKEAIFEYFKEHFLKDGYFYHGFNGSFEDQIAENGLTPDEREWDAAELQRITKIGSDHGESMILGWHDINSKNKLFYSGTPTHLYRYAVTSPEWFGQFVGEGFHVPDDGNHNKEAFYRRDYDQAKKNIMDLCDHLMSRDEELVRQRKAYPNISVEEKAQILNFFEKYWAKLAGPKSQPKAALIKRSKLAIGDYFSKESYDSICNRMKKSPDEMTIPKLIDFILQMEAGWVDQSTEDKIRAEDILVVDLPSYNQLHH